MGKGEGGGGGEGQIYLLDVQGCGDKGGWGSCGVGILVQNRSRDIQGCA